MLDAQFAGPYAIMGQITFKCAWPGLAACPSQALLWQRALAFGIYNALLVVIFSTILQPDLALQHDPTELNYGLPIDAPAAFLCVPVPR